MDKVSLVNLLGVSIIAFLVPLLQSTNLSFIVVAVTEGMELGRIRTVTGSALILAGLLSAVIFPASAQMLLGGRVASLAGEGETEGL